VRDLDPLTGLRNESALWLELSRRARSCSASRPLAVLMLDLDLLSEINAAYGREMGDRVLKRSASAVRTAAQSPRLAFRYGGEEFVVLAETANGEARELGDRIRMEIAAQNGSTPSVTVSCGVAELDAPVEPWVALDRADSALRDAKRSGRNRVVVAGHTSPRERVMLVEELERDAARRAALALAVATVEVRDTGTAEHSGDVLMLCEAVGRRLDFDHDAMQLLLAGAQLHDVGKVAMPSAILNKPGALDEDEWAVIREHTVIGERILRSVPEMAEVATIVRHAHEHWDGSGYPDGLAGTRIPLASRVILCADAFHAIRSDRPYRRGRPAGDAIAEIKACAGTQFDPAVVDALVGVIEQARTGRTPVIVAPRNRRLIALLTALAIGTGSAVAAIPEVRDAVRSVFGATTGPSFADTTSSGPKQGFGLGPLGDVLQIEPLKHRAPAKDRKPDKPVPAANRDRPAQDGAGRGERLGPGGSDGEHGGSVNGPTGGPNSESGGKLGQGPDRDAPTPPESGGGPAPPDPGGQTVPAPAPTPPASEPDEHHDWPKGGDDDEGHHGWGDDDGPGNGHGYGHDKGHGKGHDDGHGNGHDGD